MHTGTSGNLAAGNITRMIAKRFVVTRFAIEGLAI